MYVGKTATATSRHNVAMKCAAVDTVLLLIMRVGTMYVSYFICMATTIQSEMAHLKHRLRLGSHGRNVIPVHWHL